ncbi:uncharacterized protein SETTUDRAFT_38725 [Exserohilum turcica Et28A]|uniref:Uncharacterized protein n=1 Tax=Exserohilum turcicum (strain 28A) TaxID=671987 RepID=R0K4Q3_EXST2|nr:uncharacterized protein SETTUDRAFT_38725 [Exserohilum turcica Et28A]EOA88038.1 hypothetical protein SETTUDRAFT_38725 [Exserohilum turcica Et28A]
MLLRLRLKSNANAANSNTPAQQAIIGSVASKYVPSGDIEFKSSQILAPILHGHAAFDIIKFLEYLMKLTRAYSACAQIVLMISPKTPRVTSMSSPIFHAPATVRLSSDKSLCAIHSNDTDADIPGTLGGTGNLRVGQFNAFW